MGFFDVLYCHLATCKRYFAHVAAERSSVVPRDGRVACLLVFEHFVLAEALEAGESCTRTLRAAVRAVAAEGVWGVGMLSQEVAVAVGLGGEGKVAHWAQVWLLSCVSADVSHKGTGPWELSLAERAFLFLWRRRIGTALGFFRHCVGGSGVIFTRDFLLPLTAKKREALTGGS